MMLFLCFKIVFCAIWNALLKSLINKYLPIKKKSKKQLKYKLLVKMRKKIVLFYEWSQLKSYSYICQMHRSFNSEKNSMASLLYCSRGKIFTIVCHHILKFSFSLQQSFWLLFFSKTNRHHKICALNLDKHTLQQYIS